MAGYNARLFASTYRSKVAGIILIDPSIDGGSEALRAVSAHFRRAEAEADAAAGKCIRAAAAGEMRPGNPLYRECGSPPVDSPMASAAMAQAVLSEQKSSETATELLSRQERHYGDMPLIVLTAGAQYGPSTGFPTDERVALQRVWRNGHAAIAAKSRKGVHRIVDGAPHLIQVAKPEAVITAVEEVLAQAR
jgi:pimeloyl-ACP methyl ester carboxylesterase